MLHRNEEKILNLIKLGPLFIIVISVIMIYLVVNNHEKHLQIQLEKVKNETISEKKAIIKREVYSVHDYIQSELEQIRLKIRQDIKNRVYEAISIADSIYSNNQDKSKEEIQKLIFDALRNIRFNDSRGYYFIYDLDGNNLMHPILPKLEGTSLWDLQDKKGFYPAREFTKIIKKSGEGFFTWWWGKPDNKDTSFEKIGFSKLFKPYNFYIGTGEYVIDFENALKKQLLKRIQNIRFGKDGYIFIYDDKGFTLSHISKEFIGKNRINLKDKSGLFIVKDIIKAAKKGEDYINYVGTIQPSTGKPARKISYIKGFERWKWAIGAGVYLEDLNNNIKEKNDLIIKNSNSQFEKIIFINLFIFTALFLSSLYLARITKIKFLEHNQATKEKSKELEELNNTLEQKVHERTKELSEQKNIFETLFSDSSDGVILLKDSKFIDCNSSVLEILNYSKEELLSLNLVSISPEFQPDGQSSKTKIQEMIDSCFEKGNHKFEWVHLQKNGNEKWFEIVLTKLFINNEIIVHSLLRDIDDKKILEFQVLQRSKELEEALENLTLTQNKLVEAEKMSSLGVLVAGVAHEINTPVGIGLTGATHFIEATNKLKEQYDNEMMTQQEFENYLISSLEIATLIDTNLQRTALLIKNFKQISFDQSSEEKREINLKNYLGEILFSMNNIMKKTQINIKNSCDSNINIITYPGAISQIITNLIINSIRHGFKDNQEGEIVIEASSQENKIKLVYMDNGKGIDENTLPKVFDPFFTTNRENGGTGLGLNIIYNIVTNTLKGTIYCESEKNKGVKFTILFQEDSNAEKYNEELIWEI